MEMRLSFQHSNHRTRFVANRLQGDQIGRFFSVGKLFTLGMGLKIAKVAKKFRLRFSAEKNGSDYILNVFFTNSSGHPARKQAY
jgi:hypothetical protein